ncbi:1471_t:CDS:2, partial [Scutellospora calospora]
TRDTHDYFDKENLLTQKGYVSNNKALKDSMIIQEFNREIDEKREKFEKVNVYVVLLQQFWKSNKTSYVVARRYNGTQIFQLTFDIGNEFEVLFRILISISKRAEFEEKSDFDKNNDIIGKIDELTKPKEEIAYSSFVRELVNNMKDKNIMFDIKTELDKVENVNEYFSHFKLVISRKNREYDTNRQL